MTNDPTPPPPPDGGAHSRAMTETDPGAFPPPRDSYGPDDGIRTEPDRAETKPETPPDDADPADDEAERGKPANAV